jgi:hypothetical protein
MQKKNRIEQIEQNERSNKMKTKKVKRAVDKQRVLAEWDKNKNLVLNSIKTFTDSSHRTDTVTIPKAVLKQVSKLKKGDVKGLRQILYKYCRTTGLKIDSESQRKGECKHARARQHCFNPTAQMLGRPDLIVNYGKKEKKEN